MKSFAMLTNNSNRLFEASRAIKIGVLQISADEPPTAGIHFSPRESSSAV